MPWFLPLLLLATGTGLQYRSEKMKDAATARGITAATSAEDKRQDKFREGIDLSREKAIGGMNVEAQSAVQDNAAATREALYNSAEIKPADAGYQSPATEGSPRVIGNDQGRVNSAVDAFVGEAGKNRARMGAYGDMQQEEAARMNPILQNLARDYNFSGRSAALLPAEIQAAIAAGATKGRRTGMAGQFLSTLGSLAMAAPGVAEGAGSFFGNLFGKPGLEKVVEASAVPGAMSAAPGLLPTTGMFSNMSLASPASALTRTPTLAKSLAPWMAPLTKGLIPGGPRPTFTGPVRLPPRM